jgi:Zn-dependent peptidase ImmA (M78 family)/DNA-binding XRE family transcriptional regulator
MSKFNGKMVSIARESRGYTQSELAKHLSIDSSTLCRLEYDSVSPSDEFINHLSSILNYPVSFFYQSFPVTPPNVHYRKRLTLSAKIIRKADAIMNIYRANIDTLLKQIDFTAPSLPIINDEKYDNPRKVAEFLRSYWNVPRGPINDLVTLVEKFGVIVVHIDYETDKIDGRSMISESGHPIIFLNKYFAGERQRMTLAHELGHLIMHMKTVPTFARDEEEEAFDFASEFLVPSFEIRSSFKPKLTLQMLFDLKRVWKVSVAALIMSAEKIGQITPNQSRYLWAQYSQAGYRKSGEPLPIGIDSPKILEKLVDVYKTGRMFNNDEMAVMFCLSANEFKDRFVSTQQKLRLVI